MSDDRKRLRTELLAEFLGLEDFGVTKDEIEALMEQCGLPSRRSRLFNTEERVDGSQVGEER